MLIPIKINNGIEIGDAESGSQSFKDLDLKENNIKELQWKR